MLALGILVAAAGAAVPRGSNIERGAKPGIGSPAATALREALDRLQLSDALADYGERNGDPVALIQAAKIRKTLPPELTNSGVGSQVTAAGRTAETLLTRAAQIGGSNVTLTALIADARKSRDRDIPTIAAGAWLLTKVVKARAADRAEVNFKAGEPALVYVHTDLSADLDLFVYDEYNNLICADEASGQESQCRWRPRWNGSYLVDVRNKNEVEVSYELAINSQIKAR